MKYYKTGETSLILGISSDMLRYYCNKYTDIFEVPHTPQKHRLYTESDIKKLYKIIYKEELIDVESKLKEPISIMQYNELVDKLLDLSNTVETMNNNIKMLFEITLSCSPNEHNNNSEMSKIEGKIDTINDKNDKILDFHNKLLSIWLDIIKVKPSLNASDI